MDKRKNYYLVIDTETTGEKINNFMQKYTYDIGYVIMDKQGNIYIKQNYIVKEIFTNETLMSTAFYLSKKPMYEELIANNKIQLMPFAEIVKILQADIKHYNVKVNSAYNINFDMDAFTQTTQLLYGRNKFKMFFKYSDKKQKYYPDTEKFFKTYICRKPELITYDIWTMACQTLCNQKTFQAYYKVLTEKGNPITNAEIVYRYITDNNNFTEDHTALADSIIESEILARILKQHKKIEKIKYMPFKMVNN